MCLHFQNKNSVRTPKTPEQLSYKCFPEKLLYTLRWIKRQKRAKGEKQQCRKIDVCRMIHPVAQGLLS